MHPKDGPRRGAWLVRTLVLLLALVAIGYAGAVLWVVSQETTLVFQAGRPLGPHRPSMPYEQVELTRADGARQFAWVMPNGAPSDDLPWLLYLHGNASTIASRGNIAHYERLRALGLHVFAPEYRGFGGLDGVPSEPSLGTDALAAYEYLRSHYGVFPERIVIYGWSLGAAVAVDLASRVPQAAVILEGAPASLVTIGQQRYPWLPIRLLMRNPFDAVRKVGRIASPMLFIHSPEDVVIPIAEGRRLYEAAGSAKKFVEVRGGHIDASTVDEAVFYRAVGEFLEELNVLPVAAARQGPG